MQKWIGDGGGKLAEGDFSEASRQNPFEIAEMIVEPPHCWLLLELEGTGDCGCSQFSKMKKSVWNKNALHKKKGMFQRHKRLETSILLSLF